MGQRLYCFKACWFTYEIIMFSSDKTQRGLKKTQNFLCLFFICMSFVYSLLYIYHCSLIKVVFQVFKVSTGWQHFIPEGKPLHFSAATLVKVTVLQSPSVSDNCSESGFICCVLPGEHILFSSHIHVWYQPSASFPPPDSALFCVKRL